MDQATGSAADYQEVLAALAQQAGLACLALHWRPANLRGLGAASWGASGASSDVLWQGLAQGLHLVGACCLGCCWCLFDVPYSSCGQLTVAGLHLVGWCCWGCCWWCLLLCMYVLAIAASVT